MLEGEMLPCGLVVPEGLEVRIGNCIFARVGDLAIATMPTSDPVRCGALWNDNGTVKVSTGPIVAT